MNSVIAQREPKKVTRIKTSVSLRIDQVEAAREIARVERHNNVSLIFQRLIDAGLESMHSESSADLESKVAA